MRDQETFDGPPSNSWIVLQNAGHLRSYIEKITIFFAISLSFKTKPTARLSQFILVYSHLYTYFHDKGTTLCSPGFKRTGDICMWFDGHENLDKVLQHCGLFHATQDAAQDKKIKFKKYCIDWIEIFSTKRKFFACLEI